MAKWTHADVAQAWVDGAARKNERVISDGRDIYVDNDCVGTRDDFGRIIVNGSKSKGRSGSIARSAIRRKAMQAKSTRPDVEVVWVIVDGWAVSRERLLQRGVEAIETRARIALGDARL